MAPRAAAVAVTAGAATAIVGSLLTWVRSGDAGRNSYDLFRLVGRLGFAPDGPAATALRWWPAMPLLATVGAVAVWAWPRAGAVVGILAAAYAGGVAVVVLAAPARGALELGWGPPVAALGAMSMLGGSVGVLAVSRRSTAGGARAPGAAPPGGPS